MQKKKKVSKTKTQGIKKAAAKIAQPKSAVKKAAKKVAEKAPVKKEVAVKAASKAVPVKESAPVHVSKVDMKSMSADAQEQYKKWLKLQKQLAIEKASDYRMTEDFELKAPISHKVHGWGVVMQKRDNYIDVLFEQGLKTLIVNYKP